MIYIIIILCVFDLFFLISGDLSDQHDIISMKLYELDVPEGSDSEDRGQIQPSLGFFTSPRDQSGFGISPMIFC